MRALNIYANVTEEDLIDIGETAEQEKNQRDIKIKYKTLKQTHDKNLAESFALITKKLENVVKSTKKKYKKSDSPQLATENT